jgi:CAAX prenyl protease-like protein
MMPTAKTAESSQDFVSTFEYWVPMILFGVLTMLESYVPVGYYPVAYILKAVAVTASLVMFRRPLGEIHFSAGVIAPSVIIGLVVCVLWVAVDRAVPYPHLGTRVAFDPTPLQQSGWWAPFLATRLFGLVLMVPVMEEIFWRSFLLRYLTQTDFRALPMGTFSASALGIMVAASALAHPEWLVAVIASLAYALWLRRTRSLFSVIVAHGTTNAALGGYVLYTGSWQYW